MKRTKSIRRCRLCASEDNFNSFSDIFHGNPELELEIKITKLLPVVVMPWDPMPHLVCHECVGKLNSFNDFYEASLKTEKFLRGLYPSAPETELENVDPIVRVLDSPTVKRNPSKVSRGVARGPEDAETPDDAPEVDGGGTPKKSLNCFIVNSITTRDSVFTCRDCYRIFTKQSSALTHSCVGPEDPGREEDESSGKSLPPLKIRLFSIESGLFVCSLCQEPFESKTELVEHIKGHFLDGKREDEARRKCGKKKSRRRSRCQEEEEETGRKTTRRKKKYAEHPRKRRKSKSRSRDDAYETSWETREGSPSKETTETSTQREEVGKTKTKQPSAMEDAPKEGKGSGDSWGVAEEEEDRSVGGDSEDPVENSTGCDDGKSDEVTVLEVISHKTPTNFSACIFCDKIFATRVALVAHQNRHLMGHPGLRSDARKSAPDEGTLSCRRCGMTFSSRTSLEEHEGFHQMEAGWGERSIRIAVVSQGGDAAAVAGEEEEEEGKSPDGSSFEYFDVFDQNSGFLDK